MRIARYLLINYNTMNKFFKYFQFAYVAFSLFFIVRGFYEYQDAQTNMAYILWAMGGLTLFMFFFRRRYIRKFEERNRDK